LADWVRAGGALVVVDRDEDRYNNVREWWNTAPDSYKTPRQHLFEKLGIPRDAAGLHHVGRGVVLSERLSPAALTYNKDGGDTVRSMARQAAAAVNLSWKETNAMVLRRGPYVIGAGLDESLPEAEPYVLQGRFINLFDANLPVLHGYVLAANTRVFLIDLDAIKAGDAPKILAASCRVTHEQAEKDKLSFDADGIEGTNAVVRIRAARTLGQVTAGGKVLAKEEYELSDGTLLIHFRNTASPLRVEVHFAQ
jgi:hypothetical protein